MGALCARVSARRVVITAWSGVGRRERPNGSRVSETLPAAAAGVIKASPAPLGSGHPGLVVEQRGRRISTAPRILDRVVRVRRRGMQHSA